MQIEEKKYPHTVGQWPNNLTPIPYKNPTNTKIQNQVGTPLSKGWDVKRGLSPKFQPTTHGLKGPIY